MKIEKLDNNKSKIKIAFLCGFIIAVILIILINIFITKANYRKTESIPLAKGTINYTLVDFEIVEITIDGEQSTKMPVGNYELTSESYCTEKNDQFKDTKNPEIQLTYKDNILSVSNYTKKGTKCHLVFKKKVTSEDKIAELGLTKSEKGCPEVVNGETIITDIEDTQQLICSAEDNDGISYYYRGTVNNNWVKFGTNDDNTKDIWWRIVRINGDGTIRLIYSGMFDKGSKPSDGVHEIGENTLVATNQLYSGANIYGLAFWNDNTYVGFYYGKEGATSFNEAHSNTTPNNVAKELKSWYEGNDWNESYNKYIDEDAGFCNDRTKPAPGTFVYDQSQEGYGTYDTSYGPRYRLYIIGLDSNYIRTKHTPTLKCGQLISTEEVDDEAYQRDLFTPIGGSKGNQKLEAPVGLITADEVVFAGGYVETGNQSYYLYNNQYFWTMSPHSGGSAYVLTVADYGGPVSTPVDRRRGVRPVINLKADTTFTYPNGDDNKGTIENPYVVVTE